MKPARFAYARPATLDEALALRAEHGSDAALLAGGQSLVPLLNFRLARPRLLIDLGAIEALVGIDVGDGAVRVGSMTRQRDLERDEGAHRANRLLRETLELVAHPVVRNRGTVGGSIAHADAAAELPALLVTLEGSVRVASIRGEREIPAADVFLFHLTNALEPDEVLVDVRFPGPGPRTGHAAREVARRHGDYALAGAICCVTVAADGAIEAARLGWSGVAPTPKRATVAEALLVGRRPSPDLFAEAGRAAADVVESGDDLAASRALRRHLVQGLTEQVLAAATTRAREAIA